MVEEKRHGFDMLPSPSANFTLPSLFDDLELDCRLYFPRSKSKEGEVCAQGCAIFAHPYAPFGGCYDDPVVNSVGSLLLKQGYLLVTFNFRGADQSPGKTSWSGRAELGDYVAIYSFCLALLNIPEVREHMLQEQISESESKPILLLGGYSYGSMMTAHLPSIDVVVDLLQNAADGSAEKEIENRASELGMAFLGFCESLYQRGRNSRKASDAEVRPSGGVTMGGYGSSEAARKISRERSRRKVEVDRVRHSVERVRRRLVSHHGEPQNVSHHLDGEGLMPGAVSMSVPKIRYLLVSPLLGSIAGLATMFSRLKFERRGLHGVRDLPTTTPEEVLSNNNSLIVYGTADHFTSSTKVRAWCAAMKAAPGSQLVSDEIQGAGHFWHDPVFETKLIASVRSWLKSFGQTDK